MTSSGHSSDIRIIGLVHNEPTPLRGTLKENYLKIEPLNPLHLAALVDTLNPFICLNPKICFWFLVDISMTWTLTRNKDIFS